jgi:hypothetical protein
MTSRFATETLAREHTRLLDHANQLLDEPGTVDVAGGLTFKQNALDFLNRVGLGGNPVYVEVERVNFFPPLPAGPSLRTLFDKHFHGVVAFIKSRLELAPDLTRNGGQTRSRLVRRGGFAYPSAETNARGRAKTVDRLYGELRQFPPKLDHVEYEKLRTAHPRFLTFYIAEKWPDEAKPFLMCQPDRRKQGLQTAMQLAALYHNRQVSTIEDDWKRHKPRSHRR